MKKESASKIKEIADKLGVSISTVSIVLNGRGDAMRISASTQEKIWKEAERISYHPNIYARRLRTAAGGVPIYVIAVFWNVDFYHDEMLGELLRSVYEYEKEKDIMLEFVIQSYSGGNLRQQRDSISSNRYSGIFFFGLTNEDEDFLCSEKFTVPIIIMNRKTDVYCSVLNEDYEAGQICAMHYHKKGIRNVGIIGADEERHTVKSRIKGFIETAKTVDVLVKEEWIVNEQRRDTPGGYESMKHLLEQRERPEAVFVMYDTMVAGVLQACREYDIHIPKDMEIVTFGDNIVLHYIEPTVTAISVTAVKRSYAALSLMMKRLSAREKEIENVYCTPEIVYRDSSPKA